MIPKKERPFHRPRNIGSEKPFQVDQYLSNFNSIDSARAELDVKEQQLFDKAMHSEDPTQIVKAMTKLSTSGRDHMSKNDFRQGGFDLYSGKSMMMDPYGILSQGGYITKWNKVDHRTLRNMARTPFIKSIIETRVEQVAAFANPVESNTELGWMIVRREEKEGEEYKDDSEIKRIRDFVQNTGIDENRWVKDDFDKFLRKITADSLILDAATFEVVRQQNEDLFEYFAVDGGTFYFADPKEQKDKGEEIHGYFPLYVQVYQGSVLNEYYPWELCYGIRNSSSDIWRNGYGRGELEDLIQIVTWQLYGMQYTGAFFSRGSAPKGILKLAGNVNERRLQEFKQQWQAQVQGIRNAWKTPILEADKMDWVDLQKSNRDMEFSNWISFLIKVSCAIYKIDPSEIGMPMGEGAGEGGGSVFGDEQKSRLLASKEKGLKPLLKFLAGKIDKYVVQQLNPEYKFIFTGLDFEDKGRKLDEDVKRLANFMTVDEIRKRNNLEELGDENGGNLVLNAIWWQSKSQAAMGGQESNEYMDDEYGDETGDFQQYQMEDGVDETNPFKLNKAIDPFQKLMNEATEELIKSELS